MEEKRENQHCSQCGSEITREMKYCPSCGNSLQGGTELPSTKDFFKEFINYDPNIWGTLKKLIIRPGSLTKEFLEGDHDKVTSPAKLFILISAIAFLVGTVSVVGERDQGEQKTEENIDTGERPDLELEIQSSTGLRINNIEYYKDEIDSLGAEQFLISRNQQPGTLRFWIVKRTVEKYQQNEYQDINTNYERNATFLLYLLIPLFAFYMKIFRWKRSFTEHITFTLYFFSAFYLIQLLMRPVGIALGWIFTNPWPGLIAVPWVLTIGYLLTAIHKNYDYGWVKASVIGLVSGIMLLISIVLLLFFSSLLILSL